jgi:hypothetical protein
MKSNVMHFFNTLILENRGFRLQRGYNRERQITNKFDGQPAVTD